MKDFNLFNIFKYNYVDRELVEEFKKTSFYDFVKELDFFLRDCKFDYVSGTDLSESDLIDVIIEYFVFCKLYIKDYFYKYNLADLKYSQLKEIYKNEL